MPKDQGVTPTALRPPASARPAPPVEAPRKRTSLAQFFREVRAEARKVTWTSWRETWITSVMVGIMVVAAALFFFGIDSLFGFAMQEILKIGGQGG